jgi:phthalate 4,5-cis-dihydrodiol dehydrogenase
MITALDYTDFLYRPRRPEELDTTAGGGVVHSQAAHQMDVMRLLGGGLVRGVRAHTGTWDPNRPTEGAYGALLSFEGGAFCCATYSGYGHYDTDVLMDGIGESGLPTNPGDYGASRRRLREAAPSTQEAALKAARNYGGSRFALPPPAQDMAHQHFGHVVVSCTKADLRPTPRGIAIYEDDQQTFEALAPPAVARTEVIDELHAAVVHDRPPLHDGEWARATTEVCLAILESARTGAECTMRHQVGLRRQG